MASVDDGPWADAGSVFSEDAQYRYRLWLSWDEGLPRCCFVMLNPSIARARKRLGGDSYADLLNPAAVGEFEAKLDPTVRRCVGFARAWGCGSLDVVNKCAFVDGDPERMLAAFDPVGPENDEAIRQAVRGASIVVAAWSGLASFRDERVMEICRQEGARLLCLGWNQDGTPRHPLYMLSYSPLFDFPPRIDRVEMLRQVQLAKQRHRLLEVLAERREDLIDARIVREREGGSVLRGVELQRRLSLLL